MGLKAQSAVEYLTTYGWMLVVLITVAAVLFALIGERCPDSAVNLKATDIAVTEFGVDSSGNLSLELRNNHGERVQIKEINVEIKDENASFNTTQLEADRRLSAVEKGLYQLPGFQRGNSCNAVELEIVYDHRDFGEDRVTGEIVSWIGENFQVPEPPTDFNVTEKYTP